MFTASTVSPVAGCPASASLTATTMRSYVTATRGTSNSETAGKGGVESARVPAREKPGCRAPAGRRSARVRSGAMAIRDPLLRPLPAATPAFGGGWSRATTRGLVVLVGAPRAGDRDDRANQQLDVAPERPVRDVQVVQREHLLEGDVRAAMDLPEAGQARHQVGATAEAPGDALVLVLRQRARADEAHVAAQDVHELRQFVQREAPQERADAGHPRVLRDLEAPRFAGPRVEGETDQLVLHGRSAVVHRPELEDLEPASRPTDAALAKQHGARAVELDRQRTQDEHRSEDEQQGAARRDVDQALEQKRRVGDPRAGRREEGHGLHLRPLKTTPHRLRPPRNEVDVDIAVAELRQKC